MTNQPEHSTTILSRSWRRTRLVLAVLGALTMVATRSAPAQTFSVLHNFTGGADGANPFCRTLPSDLQEFCTERRHAAEPTAMAQFSS